MLCAPRPPPGARLRKVLALCCELHNAALQQCRDAWRLRHVSGGYLDQQVEFTGVRQEFDEWAAVDVGLSGSGRAHSPGAPGRATPQRGHRRLPWRPALSVVGALLLSA